MSSIAQYWTSMKHPLLEPARLLESVAQKIRRHKGRFTDLELQMLRLQVETALGQIPKPGAPPARKELRANEHHRGRTVRRAARGRRLRR